MPIRQFEPYRVVEIIALMYGSGYRIGGRLVLTAAHLLDAVGSDCKVRDKQSFGEENAQIVWTAQGLDIALIELPERIAGVEAITLGKLPESATGEKIRFQMYGYPRWGWVQRDEGHDASGYQVEGTIYLADTPPKGLLALRDLGIGSEYNVEKAIKEIKGDSRELHSEWEGMSGAAIICDGLVVAVQTKHPRPMQPNCIYATPLWRVYEDTQWRQLLERYSINPKPEIVRLNLKVNRSLSGEFHQQDLSRLEPFEEANSSSYNSKLGIAHSSFTTFREVTVWEGRNQLVEHLKDILLSPNPPKVLMLHGEGGIGKTSLAVKLIEALGINLRPFRKTESFPYHNLISLNIKEGTSFDEIIELLTIEEVIEEKDISLTSHWKIKKVLHILSKSKYLVLIDDLHLILQSSDNQKNNNSCRPRHAISDDVGRLLNALVYETHCSQIVITSREIPADLSDSRYEYTDPDPTLVYTQTLSGVEVEDGVKILRQRQAKETDEALLRSISRKVGGNPLLLTQLADILAEKPGYIRNHPEVVTEKEAPIIAAQLKRQHKAVQEFLRRICVIRRRIDIQGLTFFRLYNCLNFCTSPNNISSEYEPFQDMRFEEAKSSKSPVKFSVSEIRDTKLIVENLVNSSIVQCFYDDSECEDFYELGQVFADFLLSENQSEVLSFREIAYHFYDSTRRSAKYLEDALEAQHFAFMSCHYDESFEILWEIDNYLVRWSKWELFYDLYNKFFGEDDGNKKFCLSQRYISAFLQRFSVVYRVYYEREDIAIDLLKQALVFAEQNDDKADQANSLGELGRVNAALCNWSEAKDLYRKALQIYEEIKDPFRVALAKHAIADLEANLGHYSEAENFCRQALVTLDIWSDPDSDMAKAAALTTLGSIKSNCGEWDVAKQCYQQALQIQESLGDCSSIANLRTSLADLCHLQGEWDMAEQLYQQALEVQETLGSPSSIAALFSCIGNFERSRNNWNTARRLLRKALELRTKIKNNFSIAASLDDLGSLELDTGNWESSEAYLCQALDIFSTFDARREYSIVLEHLGDLQYRQESFDKAEKFYRDFLNTMTELDCPQGQSKGLCAIASLELKRGNWNKAEELYQKALHLAEEMVYYDIILSATYGLGKVELRKKDLSLSERLLTKALNTAAQPKKNTLMLAKVNFALAQLWREKEDVEVAQKYYGLALQIFQSLGATKELERVEREWFAYKADG